MFERRRVVVTGVGAMTPLGLSLDDTWRGLLTGESGIGRITQFDASGLPSQIAGELHGFDPTDYIEHKEARRMARCSQVAVATAQEALTDADLAAPLEHGERVGTLIGSGVGGYERAIEGVDTFRERGLRRVNPFLPISMLINMPSHHVSTWAGAKGPISTVVAACATGT
ncbi:MAG: beta-ketoacyl synthase N-terminal-like domain-containing protein, partial [Anaerolineae bacterium]